MVPEKSMPVTGLVKVAFTLLVLCDVLCWRCLAVPSKCVAGAPSSGILQLQSMFESCPPGDQNGIVGACGIAFKALTNDQGIITLIPLVLGSHKWEGPTPMSAGTFACKDLNATGLLHGPHQQSASVTLYNDLGGPLSTLAVTAPDAITLSPAHTYSWQSPPPTCTYTYKVAHGCVMGIAAPPAPPACPPGTFIAKGVARLPYCAPCPAGRASTRADSLTCAPCPRGTAKLGAGGKCEPCAEGTYAPEAGSLSCLYCSDDNHYTNGTHCMPCPAGSYVVPSNPSQCHVCNGRRRCCRINPSHDCPLCKKGFVPGKEATSTFALTSATPASCAQQDPAVCTTGFTLTVTPSCALIWQPATSQDIIRAFCFSGPTQSTIRGRTLSPTRDFTEFTAYTDFQTLTANLTAITPPYLTFTFAPLSCSYHYRALNTPAAVLLGVPPSQCPPSTPGCATLPTPTSRPICPPGTYPRRTINSTFVCVPCPPGFYSPLDSSSACSACPPGNFALGYGNTACQLCPAGTSAPEASNACMPCLSGSFAPAGAAICTLCPIGGSDKGWSYCLGNHLGSICCAAGDCSGPPCPPTLIDPTSNHATLQLLSTQLSDPACKSATFLSCLAAGAYVAVTFNGGVALQLVPVNQPACVIKEAPELLFQLSGNYMDVNNASLSSLSTSPPIPYTLRSHRLNSTFSLYLTPTPSCRATFTLASGFLLDQAALAGAACPAASYSTEIDGRSFCSFCNQGEQFLDGKCAACPPGSEQGLFGAPTCLPCAAGSAGQGTSCTPCSAGTYALDGWPACRACPANTFSAAAASDCSACPRGTAAPARSSACSTPFRA